MAILQVGATAIPYTVTRSRRARRQRIVVTNGNVEVIVPEGTADDAVIDFVQRRRRWLFDTRAKMLERSLELETPQGFVSGSKVLYRGRRVILRVRQAEGDKVTVSYRGGFEVTVPDGLEAIECDRQVEAALHHWMRDRLWEDVSAIVARTCQRLGIETCGFRLREQKHLWGSCGKNGVIYLNWRLVEVPKPVLEYAVIHEVCHLKHRTHSMAFWRLVGSMMPGYEAGKLWLEVVRRPAGSS
ncbi:MAG: M48 family metallopeptidase [Cyanobacteria bacterium REEB65]|nr:M48 family metallopeptidase [Cyanobacteria bacterium REEB65]